MCTLMSLLWNWLRLAPHLLEPGLYISPTCRLHRVLSTTQDGRLNVMVDGTHHRILEAGYFDRWERVADDEDGLARAMAARP